MVTVGEIQRIIGDLTVLKGKYMSIVDSLANYWQGPSYKRTYESIEAFIEEYFGTIDGQMQLFCDAVEIYSNYEEADNMLNNANSNLNLAITSGDSVGVTNANTDINRLESDKGSFRNNIESCLANASTPILDATPLNLELSSTVAAPTTTSTSASSGTTMTQNASTTSSDIDMENYPTGDSLEDGLARATLVAEYLQKNGGFTAEQAAALAGCYVDENNCKPNDYMEAEAAGLGVAGTGGDGYGAGIGSWTFSDTKNQALADAGYSAGTPIESLSLKEQCDMIIAQSQKSDKVYYDALKRCDTIEDASATAVVYMGGVGYSNSWSSHPTTADAHAVSELYRSSNDARFGVSDYHGNLDVRRLDYAKQIYSRMTQ